MSSLSDSLAIRVQAAGKPQSVEKWFHIELANGVVVCLENCDGQHLKGHLVTDDESGAKYLDFDGRIVESSENTRTVLNSLTLLAAYIEHASKLTLQ